MTGNDQEPACVWSNVKISVDDGKRVMVTAELAVTRIPKPDEWGRTLETVEGEMSRQIVANLAEINRLSLGDPGATGGPRCPNFTEEVSVTYRKANPVVKAIVWQIASAVLHKAISDRITAINLAKEGSATEDPEVRAHLKDLARYIESAKK